MSWLDSVLTALDNLHRHKLRSLLTMLGVIIGVAAVILMVSLVEGARANVVAEFQRLGSSLILVAFDPGKLEQGQTRGSIDGLTMDDARAILTYCPSVERVGAQLDAGSMKASRGKKSLDITLKGVQPMAQVLHNIVVAKGRYIEEADVETWSKAAVVGAEVVDRLFGKTDPIGQQLTIANVEITIIGVIERKGRGMDGNADVEVHVPITSLHKRFIGRELVSVIFAQPVAREKTDAAMNEIWQLLMRRSNNVPLYRVDSQERILGSIGRVLSIFGLVVGAVAGLSLLVGGIGIMNIMLVTVTERTREIGLRKAVGARNRDVLWQFLIESMTISGLGGLIGVGLGWGGSLLIGVVTKAAGLFGGNGLPTHLPVWAAVGGFVFAAVVGIGFGLYPALSASRLNPIQALRSE